jgi:hypothetical protein
MYDFLPFFRQRSGLPLLLSIALIRFERLLTTVADHDFCPSRTPDHGYKNRNKREGRKKFVVPVFFVATNITKLKIILILNW